MKPALTVVVLILFLRSAQSQESVPMVVHEWGTFTSLQDESGTAIGGINTDDEPVPDFVYRPSGGLLPRPTELPPAFFGRGQVSFGGKGIPSLHGDVTMRLETPVMYFYPHPGSILPIEMDVKAGFRGGWLLEYYPKAELEADGLRVASTRTRRVR